MPSTFFSVPQCDASHGPIRQTHSLSHDIVSPISALVNRGKKHPCRPRPSHSPCSSESVGAVRQHIESYRRSRPLKFLSPLRALGFVWSFLRSVWAEMAAGLQSSPRCQSGTGCWVRSDIQAIPCVVFPVRHQDGRDMGSCGIHSTGKPAIRSAWSGERYSPAGLRSWLPPGSCDQLDSRSRYFYRLAQLVLGWLHDGICL